MFGRFLEVENLFYVNIGKSLFFIELDNFIYLFLFEFFLRIYCICLWRCDIGV